MTKKTYQFEKEHACVLVDYDDKEATRIFVQCIDAYGRQLELILQHEPTNGGKAIDVHVYRHPGVRRRSLVTHKAGQELMNEFLMLCEKYPTLLFNVTGHGGQAQNRGFVLFHTALLDGAEITKDLL
jgi:hypothetical protein